MKTRIKQLILTLSNIIILELHKVAITINRVIIPTIQRNLVAFVSILDKKTPVRIRSILQQLKIRMCELHNRFIIPAVNIIKPKMITIWSILLQKSRRLIHRSLSLIFSWRRYFHIIQLALMILPLAIAIGTITTLYYNAREQSIVGEEEIAQKTTQIRVKSYLNYNDWPILSEEHVKQIEADIEESKSITAYDQYRYWQDNKTNGKSAQTVTIEALRDIVGPQQYNVEKLSELKQFIKRHIYEKLIEVQAGISNEESKKLESKESSADSESEQKLEEDQQSLHPLLEKLENLEEDQKELDFADPNIGLFNRFMGSDKDEIKRITDLRKRKLHSSCMASSEYIASEAIISFIETNREMLISADIKDIEVIGEKLINTTGNILDYVKNINQAYCNQQNNSESDLNLHILFKEQDEWLY